MGYQMVEYFRSMAPFLFNRISNYKTALFLLIFLLIYIYNHVLPRYTWQNLDPIVSLYQTPNVKLVLLSVLLSAEVRVLEVILFLFTIVILYFIFLIYLLDLKRYLFAISWVTFQVGVFELPLLWL